MKINYKELRTKSNQLSLFRVFLAIPSVIFILNIPTNENFRTYTFALCILAFITDILDGFLARKFNEVTEMGKIIDPLADKAMVIAIIISLFWIGEISLLYLLIIISRDMIIFSGGILVSRKINKVLPSNMLGKLTVLSIGLFILAVLLDMESISQKIYYGLYYTSILMSFVSVFGYALRGYESIKWHKNEHI